MGVNPWCVWVCVYSIQSSTHQQGAAAPGGHHLARVEHGLEHEGEGSLELGAGLLHHKAERDPAPLPALAMVDVPGNSVLK